MFLYPTSLQLLIIASVIFYQVFLHDTFASNLVFLHSTFYIFKFKIWFNYLRSEETLCNESTQLLHPQTMKTRINKSSVIKKPVFIALTFTYCRTDASFKNRIYFTSIHSLGYVDQHLNSIRQSSIVLKADKVDCSFKHCIAIHCEHHK